MAGKIPDQEVMMKSISMAEVWSALSQSLYGEDIVSELHLFLQGNRVKTVLECGCGDGHILKGLAEKGYECVGIDASAEMIRMAETNNSHPKVQYQLLNWLELSSLGKTFDAVICRGNSLSAVTSWDDSVQNFDSAAAKTAITHSLRVMYGALNPGGILYVDTVSQSEIDQQGGRRSVSVGNVHLHGQILHDWKKRMRIMWGSGTVHGQHFEGIGVTYLQTPEELETLIAETCSPQALWFPVIMTEENYQPICAKKGER